MFDLNIPKILVLGVLALVIFGPEQLPKMAAQAGQALRDLRRLADRARADLSDSLGPEFSDFDFNDLNPRSFVRKHLLEGLDEEGAAPGAGAGAGVTEPFAAEPVLAVGEIPPYDPEAT